MPEHPERPHRPRLALRHRLLVAACALVTVPALIPGNAVQAASATGAGNGGEAAGAAWGQVRVDQVGYANGAPETRVPHDVDGPSGCACSASSTRAATLSTRRWSAPTRDPGAAPTLTSTRSTSTPVHREGSYPHHRQRRVDAGAVPGLPHRHGREGSTQRRWRTRSRSIRTSEMDLTSSRPRCAPRRGTSTTRTQ